VAWSRSPLRPRQVRWQVAQHPDLAAAQRLQQRPRLGDRLRAWPASKLRMSATRAAWAVRCWHDAPAGPGRGVAGTPSLCHWVRPGPVRAPGRVQRRPGRRTRRGRSPPAGKPSQPGPPVGGNWAAQDRFERRRRGTRVVSRQPQRCRGDAYLAVFAALLAKPGECLLGALGLARAHQGMQRCPCPGDEVVRRYATSPACPVCIRPAASRRLIKHARSRRELDR
jgi:hypothetical protein